MKKPLFKNIKIKDKQIEINQDSCDNSPDKVSSKVNMSSPMKGQNVLSENGSVINITDEQDNGLNEEELSLKHQISLLDENKKKAFYKYKKWKYSLYSEKNVKSNSQFQFIENHYKEYHACSIVTDQNEKPPSAAIKKNQSRPRIQSAKSGISHQRNMNAATKNSNTNLISHA